MSFNFQSRTIVTPKWRLLVVILILLIISALVLRVVDLRHRRNLNEAKRFKVETCMKEGVRYTSIFANNQPVYAESTDRGMNTFSYYAKGKNVLQIDLDKTTGQTKGAVVDFYDTQGEPLIRWVDHTGRGEFVDRVVYREGKSHREIWYDGKWVSVEEREGRRGVILQGLFSEVSYDQTNGAWHVKAPSVCPAGITP
jgi:hypothetical protein